MQKIFFSFLAGCIVTYFVFFGINLFNGRNYKTGNLNRAAKVETITKQSVGITREIGKLNQRASESLANGQGIATVIRSENRRTRIELDNSIKGIDRIEAIIKQLPRK